jgi:hypothetical protein
MGNEFSVITPDIKRKIIQGIIGDGTWLDISGALKGKRKKLRDEDVVNIINDDDVDPARVTTIDLQLCTGITDKALIAIADTCPNLTVLYVGYCSQWLQQRHGCWDRCHCKEMQEVERTHCL